MKLLGIKAAASTVWQILHDAGIDPAPERATTTWGAFLRSQAEAILACDLLETVTLSGQRRYVLAAIEPATRHIRILRATAHPTAAWVTQAARNLVMDLQDAGATVRHLVRDRDAKFPALFDEVLANAGIEVVLSGVRMPRMDAVMARWVRICRSELLDRALIWNHAHLIHAPRQFESHHNEHRAHRTHRQTAPLHPVPEPVTEPARIIHLDVRRHDRLGGISRAYERAA